VTDTYLAAIDPELNAGFFYPLLSGTGVAFWCIKKGLAMIDVLTLLLITGAVPVIALVIFMSVAKTKRRRRLIQNFR
jgi:hypothetical protein